jgi:hypothetical protein
MPFIDALGERVEKGELVTDSRVVAVAADGGSETIKMSGLTTVEDATAQFVNPDSIDASDGINDVDPSVGDDNDVQVNMSSGGTANDRDVEVVATGY